VATVSVHDRRAVVGLLGSSAALVVAAVARVLTRNRVCVYSAAGGVLVAAASVANLVRVHWPLDAADHPVLADFAAQITAGTVVRYGELNRLYDLRYQSQVQHAIFPGLAQGFLNPYLSPPFMAYVWSVFAAVPYAISATVWALISIVLFVASVRLIWPLLRTGPRFGYGPGLLVVFTSWPVLECLLDGQDSAVSLFLLALGLRLLLSRRDARAGIVLALGMFKPQLFLLTFVVLILQRRWRALIAWAGTGAALASVSLALVGWDGARAYVAILSADVYQQALATRLWWKMQSLPGALRAVVPASATLPFSLASLAVALAALAYLAGPVRRQGSEPESLLRSYVLAVLLTAIGSPHLLLYDAAILILPSLILLDRMPTPGTRVAVAGAYVATWTAPLRTLAFGQLPGLLAFALAGPWVLVPVAALVWIGVSWQPDAAVRAGDLNADLVAAGGSKR
jgi:hypothetical protein